MTPPPRTRTFTIVRAPAAAAVASLRKYPLRSRALQTSGHALQRVAQDRRNVVDVAALDDQRRRQREGIAGIAKHEAAVEAVDHDVVAACYGGIRPRRQFHTRDETNGPDVDHVRQTAQRMHGVLPVVGELGTAREQTLFP